MGCVKTCRPGLVLGPLLVGLLFGCAPVLSSRPLTPDLARRIFTGPEELSRIQVYYQGRLESSTGSVQVHSTVFRSLDESVDRALTIDKNLSLTERRRVRSDEIRLANNTPGVIVATRRTLRGFQIEVDFGGNTILEFESRSEEERFLLQTERIESDGRVFLRERDTFGYLTVAAYESTESTYEETVREIPGRSVQ
jgi:hypothetical protein